MTLVRYRNAVRLRSGAAALAVNWFEMTVGNAKPGQQLYHHSGLTKHRLTAANVGAIAQAGRGRWTIENANNNVLQTKGYPLAPNFGHGTQYLAAFLLRLHLLALLCHPVLEGSDDQDAVLRQVIARRQSFFHDLQALRR